MSKSPEKLILYCADFRLRDSENPGDFFYSINLTIDAEAHSDDSLFLRGQRGLYDGRLDSLQGFFPWDFFN